MVFLLNVARIGRNPTQCKTQPRSMQNPTPFNAKPNPARALPYMARAPHPTQPNDPPTHARHSLRSLTLRFRSLVAPAGYPTQPNALLCKAFVPVACPIPQATGTQKCFASKLLRFSLVGAKYTKVGERPEKKLFTTCG